MQKRHLGPRPVFCQFPSAEMAACAHLIQISTEETSKENVGKIISLQQFAIKLLSDKILNVKCDEGTPASIPSITSIFVKKNPANFIKGLCAPWPPHHYSLVDHPAAPRKYLLHPRPRQLLQGFPGSNGNRCKDFYQLHSILSLSLLLLGERHFSSSQCQIPPIVVSPPSLLKGSPPPR